MKKLMLFCGLISLLSIEQNLSAEDTNNDSSDEISVDEDFPIFISISVSNSNDPITINETKQKEIPEKKELVQQPTKTDEKSQTNWSDRIHILAKIGVILWKLRL